VNGGLKTLRKKKALNPCEGGGDAWGAVWGRSTNGTTFLWDVMGGVRKSLSFEEMHANAGVTQKRCEQDESVHFKTKGPGLSGFQKREATGWGKWW